MKEPVTISKVSVGVIYDLKGSRNDDLVYFQWLDDNNSLIRGEIYGVKFTSSPEACMEAGLSEDGLELIVCNFYSPRLIS